MITAAAHGHPKIATALLAAGARPGASDAEGRTAVYWATRNRHAGVAMLLNKARFFTQFD